MTKFVIRRIIQAIPTLIGITIIAYFIMDIAPGNPLSQLTLDPNLDAAQRSAIFEANGFNDPTIVKYFRWLIGDAPITFNQNPAYAVQMNDGETVIIDASNGEVLEVRPTSEMSTNVTDNPIRRGRAGEQPISPDEAQLTALETIGDVSETTVVDTNWIPRYISAELWAVNLSNGTTTLFYVDSGEVLDTFPTTNLSENPLYEPLDSAEASGTGMSIEDAETASIQRATESIRINVAQYMEDYLDTSVWAVSLSNRDTVIIDTTSGEVLVVEETVLLRQDDAYAPQSSDFAGEQPFVLEDARALALQTARDEISVESTNYVPNYPLTSGWLVDLSNGESLVYSSSTGFLQTRVRTEDFDRSAYELIAPEDLTDAQNELLNFTAERAGELAVIEVPTALVQWLPYYDAFVIWQGRQLPYWRSGEIVGEEVGSAGGVLRGDFGISYVSNDPTTQAIGQRIGATFELGAISLLVGTIIGIPVGVLAAVYQGSIFDQVTRIGAVLVSAIPVFWLGLILLLIFGSWLQILPMGNRFPISFSGDYTIGERLSHLILPVFTLSSFTVATFSRFMRASLLNVLGEDYVRTARAKGLSDRKVWFKHALRNAMIPIATIIGPALTNVLGGAVLTETIYSWPGMGTLVVNSVTQQDYPVIMGVVLLTAVLTIIGFLISDILYAVFDPRIRLG